MLSGLIGELLPYLIGAGMLLLGALGLYRKGRKDERRANDSDRLEAMKGKKEKDDEVDQLGPADLDQRFDRWLSDDER